MEEKTHISNNLLLLNEKFKNKNNLKCNYHLKKNLFITLSLYLLFIIFILLINFLFFISKQKPIRILSTNNSVGTSNNEGKDEDIFPYILLICYIFFIVLSLYMILMLKKNSDKTEDIRLEVLKFMYMSNNGYLLVSVVDISITNNGAIYIITSVGSIILVIGTIIYIVKFIKVICVGFLETYFSFNMFKTWICLPFQFVWPFMGLTDPCCYSNTYTVTYHSDGTVTDDKAFVICFNKTMFCVKRFAFIISTLLYYFFY